METNVASKRIRCSRKLLVVGKCIADDHPHVLEKFKDYTMVTVCPEAIHINMIGLKLASAIARCRFEEVAVLTTDGSMHCIQLHYIVEELEKVMGGFRRRHFVYENGEVVEIPPRVVKISRYLSRIARLVERLQLNTFSSSSGEV